MSANGTRYARVYHSIRTDPRLQAIYHDDRLLASYVRLLLDADAAFPAPASIPRWIKPARLRAFVQLGAIKLLEDDLFRMPTLDEDRGQRRSTARKAAEASWESRRTADAHANADADAGAPAKLPDDYQDHYQSQGDRYQRDFDRRVAATRRADHRRGSHSLEANPSCELCSEAVAS